MKKYLSILLLLSACNPSMIPSATYVPNPKKDTVVISKIDSVFVVDGIKYKLIRDYIDSVVTSIPKDTVRFNTIYQQTPVNNYVSTNTFTGSGTYLLKTVNDFKTFDATTVQVQVLDNTQGGLFQLYSGNDTADGGMVFQDKLGRKWERITEGERLYLKWYGLVPTTNYYVDDAIVINKALGYIKEHRSKFSILKVDYCQPNTFYRLGSTVVLSGVTLEGVGEIHRPHSVFAINAHITGFRIPAGEPTNVINIKAGNAWDYVHNYTDSTNHSFDIHTVVNFDNVYVNQNQNGDGFHVDACAYSDRTDTAHYGNADQSTFVNCQAENCINGFYINGCDANVISFMSCSAMTCFRWGFYDNGLLGNKYWNCHAANCGKVINSGATLNHDTATYFLRGDFGAASIGKRPDLHPEYWYQNDTGLGGVTAWDSTRQYWSGGPFWGANPNANNLYIGIYTESYQPMNIIGQRSNWIEGLNGASIIGGMWEHTYGGAKFFSGYGIQSDRIFSKDTLIIQK